MIKCGTAAGNGHRSGMWKGCGAKAKMVSEKGEKGEGGDCLSLPELVGEIDSANLS
jgi:hypothetical protein